MRDPNKYIWMFGENLGETANNNSFYLWRYIVNNHDDVLPYFIIAAKREALDVYKSLTARERQFVVWRNSPKHILLYAKADLLFVSVSYRDVQPDRILFKSYKPMPEAPLVYVQHGCLGIKRLDYESSYANNSMIRFLIYNPTIREKLIRVNGFKDYQLLEGVFQPRFSELARRALARPRQTGSVRRVLWFITWREYSGDHSAAEKLIEDVAQVLSDQRLSAYLYEQNRHLTICLHRYFGGKLAQKARAAAADHTNVRVVYAQDMDIMDLLVDNDLMITDYSSVGYDFTFLDKPVILYQPDYEEYSKTRAFYCEASELEEASIRDREALIDAIINGKYAIHSFFKRGICSDTDLKRVAADDYNERLYAYFRDMMRRTIAFLGYDFSGVGGTVFATKALAEGLLEKGYLVRFYTLKQMHEMTVPAGVALKPATRQHNRRLVNKIVEKLFFAKAFYGHLKYDPAQKAMRPFAGIAMKYWMKDIHSSVIVSTRESLHLYLLEAISPFIKEKIYFFHTSSQWVETLFPGVMNRLQSACVRKAAFVTEKNRLALKQKGIFSNYEMYGVIGNGLDSGRCIEYDEIGRRGTGPDRNCSDGKLHCAYLLRISRERSGDIDNLINFVLYLREVGCKDIVFDVYGKGDYVDEFLDLMQGNTLKEYIAYHGEITDIKGALSECDVVVDFSNEQSFGMTYIEAVLNGKMVYCKHNEGSDEVLKGIPDAFYTSNETLYAKLRAARSIDLSVLEKNYEAISSRYSRAIVASRFLELVNR